MSLGELGGVYERTRERIVDLVAGRDGIDGSIVVPACPQWSVHDLIAHLAGTCADILGGNIAGATTLPWTTAQVEKRRDRRLRDVIAEWS
ncbi:MAG TPA: maleylpyruvate isomerase N-terminal domain-containing protein, partial [Actinomycetota bacterium]